MRRSTRILGWTAGVIGVLVAIVGGALYFVATSDYVRNQIEARLGAATGHKTRIGTVSIDWGATSRVHLSDVQIANASWGKAEHMFKAARIDFDVRLWPLLGGNLVLPQLAVRRPEINLERNAQDHHNWAPEESPLVGSAVQAAAPSERHQTPLIGRLEVTDGRMNFNDLKRKIDLSGTVATATGQAGEQPQAELSLKGHLQNQPLAVRFIGGSALMLRETEKPYPVDLSVDYGATKLAVRGSLQDPIQWKGANVQLALSGPDLSDIYPLLGIPGPPTSPYRITGRLDREAGLWKVTQSSWHIGDSDLRGDITIDDRTEPGHLTANLVSQSLTFADLAPLIGATPGKRGNVSAQQLQTEQQIEAQGELFPNVPLHVERMRAMNMDVTFDARRVIAPSYLPVSALSFHVKVENGQATVRPLVLGIANGRVGGELSVDARSDIPRVRTDLSLQNLDFGAFFRGSRFFGTNGGKIQGRVALAGSGRSVAQVMGVADGRVELALANGSVSDLMVSLAGLQIIDALALYVTGDHRIPIQCALARLDLRHGDATFDRTLLDTRRSVLSVDGRVALSSQLVDIRVSANPKKFDLLDLHGPVLVSGKIRAPAIKIARGIPIPTPVIGTAKDVPCEALTQQLLRSN